jgi:HK97 family phage major capsid protein
MATNQSIARTDGAALIPEDFAKDIITAVAKNSAVMQLAKKLPNMSRGQQRIAVLDTLPNAYWVSGDTGLKQTTKLAWKNVYLNAEELAVIVPLPQALLDDTDYNIAESMKPALVEAMGIAFDQAILFGTNKPSTYPTDIVTQATSAGNTVQVGTGGADLYDDIFGSTGMLQKVRSDGYAITGHVADLTMEGLLESVRDADGNPIFNTLIGTSSDTGIDLRLKGRPIIMPENGAWDISKALMVSGQWDQLVYSIRQDITYTISQDASIFDNAGNLVYSLFQQDMVAVRAVMRIAAALPNPVNRINSNSATRFPFGAILP